MYPDYPPEHPYHAQHANGSEEYELRTVDVLLYDPEADKKIVDWRATCFIGYGLDELHANALALRRDIDREDVRRLTEEGASSEQVSLILL